MHVLTANAPPLLVKALARRGVALTVLDTPAGLQCLSNDDPQRISLVPFTPRLKLDITAMYSMRRAISERGPSVIHTFLPKATASAILATTGFRQHPPIISFRGITFTPTYKDPGNWITVLHPRVKHHSCESNAVTESLLQAGIAPSRCSVVYNCVKLARTSAEQRLAIRQRFGIPAEAFVIGTVATIRRVKGIDLLLRAAAECSDLRDTWWLVAGPIRDPMVHKLAGDRRIAPRLRLTGPVPDGHAIGGAMDLFVMPSRREALCRGLLEAMSRGACPVCSDAGGMKEIVRHNREGLIFPVENIAALTAAIRDLHADRIRVGELADAAVARVNAMCSPDAMADRVMEAHAKATA